MLADYAVRVEQSRGRRYPEPQHPYRNDFQRDRDRVIHSRAFRRLEAKTQVFTRRYSDHFRNRLTHTIEVAQIARTIAAQLGLNVDLVEALALVHDVGHPPFGHAGEKALDTAMRKARLFFDHNLHALRIVEDFELRYAAFRGLNLTFEVREGIIKHSHDYVAAQFPELAEYLLDQRPPLEAQLIDVADEIAYSTADLDDGYEARLLTLETNPQRHSGIRAFLRRGRTNLPGRNRKAEIQRDDKAHAQSLGGRLDREYERSRSGEQGSTNLEDVRDCPHRLVTLSPEVEEERRGAKEFLYTTLYYSATLNPEKNDAGRDDQRAVRVLDGEARQASFELPEKATQERPATSHLRLHRGHDGQLHLRTA